MTAERHLIPVERLEGSGRQPAEVQVQRDAVMELRVARHEVLAAGNELRQIGRTTQYLGQREGCFEVVQLGMAIEARGVRLINQWSERR